jgi:hypothetical protein
MLYVPATTTGQVIVTGLTINGTNGSADPYTYLMEFEALSSFAMDGPILSNVLFANTNGIGLSYGGNRGNLTCYDVNFSACGNQGASIGGADSTWYHSEFGYCGVPFTITGSFTRMHDIDVYNNTSAAVIEIYNVTIDGKSSFNQNGKQAIVVNSVDGAGKGIYIEARFQSNGNSANATYPHVDVSAAAALGVTFGPNCSFDAVAGGSYTNTTTYDVYTNGVAFMDSSRYESTASASGHTDLGYNSGLPQCVAPNGIPGHILNEIAYNPSGNNTYSITSATLAEIDAAHLSLYAAAGPSGKVWVEWDAPVAVTSGSGNLIFGALVSGSAQPNPNFVGAPAGYTKGSCKVLLTGLTPGTVYEFQPGALIGGSATGSIIYGSGSNGAGPLNMKVIEA